eukprot:TRINITY_DN67737_c13_g1_i1.p1 TRINITY_DN67737_c13_g1~~TRINITY_DN67737_c13_g1_i1.p1  ORF type:complete len:152 (-),score=15.48 TRINITY_DN67737_c13_g1_i1:195-650(-)
MNHLPLLALFTGIVCVYATEYKVITEDCKYAAQEDCELTSECQWCDSQCVNIRFNKDHCGSCGAGCMSPKVCGDAKCRLAKSFTLDNPSLCKRAGCKWCATQMGALPNCVNLKWDDIHCGGCNINCNKGESCVLGKCKRPNKSMAPPKDEL